MHLHVICTDPDPSGHQILVSISTFEEGDDTTCILLPPHHPWLWKERSFVDYSFADFRLHRDLVNGVRAHMFKPKSDLNGQDFLRVRSGIERSPFTPILVKEAYRASLAILARVETETNGRGAKISRPVLRPVR